jgi:hypothetical protein
MNPQSKLPNINKEACKCGNKLQQMVPFPGMKILLGNDEANK